MKYRTLGRTGLKVSEIGMGTWQLAGKPWGWDMPDEKESLRALQKHVELGGNFIDTALVYGDSEYNKELRLHTSEQLISEFLHESGCRNKVIIATKIPPKNRKWPAWKGIPISKVFPNDYIEECVDSSLKNLKIETIDLMQFHVWQDDFANDDEWKEKIQKITKKGKVRYWGISINDYQPSNCLKTLETGHIDTVQLIFNVFHQRPIDRLFPFAKRNNIGLIARVPLDEGGLTGRIKENTEFDDEMRSVYFNKERRKELIKRTEILEKLLDRGVESLPELALRFILSFPEISTTIPGMRKVRYAIENVKASDKGPLDASLIDELRNHSWERNFYPDFDPAMKDDGYIER